VDREEVLSSAIRYEPSTINCIKKMPTEITMPQLSDTMSEGTVVKWLKREGEKVTAGEKIAEVETDKAVMEMESFDAGTLAHIVAREGDKVAVGQPIAVLATSKESPADVKKNYQGVTGGVASATPSAPAAKAVAESSRPQSNVATIEQASSGELHEPESVVGHGATREPPTAVPPVPHHGGNGNGEGGRLIVSPLARRIAADKGFDLTLIKGTGPNGRIVQKDVLAFIPPAAPSTTDGVASGTPATSKTPPASTPKIERVSRGQTQVVPLTKMRQAIAKGLQASKQNIPHFYETVDVDVEELSALRVRLNTALESEKVRLSLGDLISKAVAVALLKHPALNAHYDAAKNEITRFGDVHLGFAVALPDGLIVPVLRNVDQMGLKELRNRSVELIDSARAQRLKTEEARGATFTISSLGTYGVREFSAIINPPAVAILAVASAEKRAVVRPDHNKVDQIVARTMLTLTLSADHRAVDGAVAAEFLRTLKGLLEEPGLMLV
jgi:pyruvate dehydrogenase E2 component (dihydrolipoamide acetyltransferase)